MKKIITTLVLVAVLIIGAVLSEIFSVRFLNGDYRYGTTIAEVMSNRRSYVGRRVQISGYLRNSGELHLFTTKDMADIGQLSASIFIYDDVLRKSETYVGEERQCADGYAQIRGTIEEEDRNSGIILTNIETIMIWFEPLSSTNGEMCYNPKGQ